MADSSAFGAPAGAGVGAGTRWALMFGNFVIGCGVMAAPGTLNDIAKSLGVTVSLAGQLIAIGAAAVAFGAPLLAGWVSGFDRRRLLALALLWYGAGHALCALMPSYATLWPVRAATLLAAAVFTPQAAAATGVMAAPHARGRAITFVFLGWSLASVIGMPIAAWLGETFGWRVAFDTIAALALIAAVWVYAAMPDGVRPAALSLRAWKNMLMHPVLVPMVLVTALSGAGQFTLFTYFTPYYRQVLGADTDQIALLLMWFGACGLAGNLLLTRVIDRVGPNLAVAATLSLMAVSLLVWPLAVSIIGMALVLLPWGLGCFASNSTQQARLSIAAPSLAPALLALNTSAIFVGQAAGAVSGGWLIAHGGFAPLHWVGLAWMLLALAVSVWVGRQSVVLA
jgi:predicted MFS family arabinose efflux permease